MADREGVVLASVPGLAGRAKVGVEECRAALKRFQMPDEDSSSKVCEGRRIEPIEGGWRLINHIKYRDLKDSESEKERKAQWWRENRGKHPQTEEALDEKLAKLANPSANSTKLASLAISSSSKRSTPLAPSDEKTPHPLVPASSPNLVSLPKVTWTESGGFDVDPRVLEGWQKACPALDLATEIAKAHAWVIGNPKNRKSNWQRFLTSWVLRAQDRAPARGRDDPRDKFAGAI